MNNKKIIAFLLLFVMLLTSFTGCKNGANGPMNQTYIMEETEGFYDRDRLPSFSSLEDGRLYDARNRIKVVSYNIRCANDDNGNSIKERAPRLEKVINKYDPDVMGFQEFVPEWNKYVQDSFYDEYDYLIHYRAQDNYEGTPVFWKRAKFKLLDSGMFWLSDTPDQESCGWNAACYRVCSWVKLEVRATGKVFYYYNTHFDYTEPPQEPSARLLQNRIEGPAIITGDFNMERNSKGYAAMTEMFADANIYNDETATFTDYGRLKNPTLIDYVFTSRYNAKAVDYEVMDEMPGGKYVSDHFGVYSEVIVL